jgi:hypothetical protein
MHTLLHDSSRSVILQVEQVLRVLGHHSHASIEVQPLQVGHNLKSLLPSEIRLIQYRKQRDGHRGGSDEVALTQGGECDGSHLLDSGVGLATDDSPRPRLYWVKRYHQAGLVDVQVVDHGQAATVDRNFPAVAKANESVVEHLQELRAMLAHGTQSPVLGEEEVGVVVHVQLKSQP